MILFSGPKCCFMFSLIAILFLSIVAYLLWSDSLYLKVNAANANRKPQLANGVIGAIILYSVSMSVSAYFWMRSASALEPPQSPRFEE
jgi:hypothetical protein